MDVASSDESEEREVVSGVHNMAMLEGERTNLLRFRIEPGESVPEHSHPHEQIGYIIGGEATFRTDGETRTLGPGDAYRIPGGEPHRLDNDGSEPVLGIDVFSPPRDLAPFAEGDA
jgi:quercetin dioxygenase-like cupin family protein